MTLANGDQLPHLPAVDLEGNSTAVDALTQGSWSVVLFYRGHW